MRVRLMSDLHLEFEVSRKPTLMELPWIGEDLLVLAGDIQVGMAMQEWFTELLSKREVIYILGNHEYYHNDFSTLVTEAIDFARSVNIEAKRREYPHELRFLEKGIVVYEDLMVLGTTLWANIPVEDEAFVKWSMNDYAQIHNGTNLLTVKDVTKEWQQCAAFLTERIPTLPQDKKLLVVTHHAPSFRSVPPQFAGRRLNVAYASNLDDLVARADVWVHGHMHQSADYKIGNCRVICNPRGYYKHKENNNFNPDLLVDF